ncbi:MAG TPA: apolipoprotein N-acyltransferase [Candidatus Eisenbacteria bacterium]|nr:apolipoprotein N-acyltransferase [Candidatus Eisenbacteria bacterium]
MSLSFPTIGAWPLVFVALVPLLLVIHDGSPAPGAHGAAGRASRWAPWLTGIVAAILVFHWITRIPTHAMTQPWLIWPALLFLGLYVGLYTAFFGWIVRVVRRRLGVSVFLVAPVAWSAAEWLKSAGELGCPWGNLGTVLAGQPAWVQWASVVGTQGLTLWIVTVNALVAAALVKFVGRRWVEGVLRLALGVAILALPPLWGADRLRDADRVAAASPGLAEPIGRVALVQPNIPSDQKWNPAHQDSVVNVLYRMTQEAVDAAAAADSSGLDLVVWPETALPFYVRLEPLKLRRLLDTAKAIKTPILAGYPDARLSSSGDVTTHNASGLVLRTGSISGQYEKIHLVPFGERIPFQGLFPFLGRFDLGQAEWTPGTEQIVFGGAGPTFGVMICFESIFPDHARRYRLAGAQYLVNITNDEWFGKSAGPVQHADLAVLRAVELGMGMVRAANTGISMIVDPYGRVTSKTELFVPAVVVGNVPAPLPPTRYAQWGDWTTVLSLVVVVLLLAAAWFRPVGRRPEPLAVLKSPPTFPG